MIYLLGYIIVGVLFLLYYWKEIFIKHDDSYSMSVMAVAILTGPLIIISGIALYLNLLIASFIYRVFE